MKKNPFSVADSAIVHLHDLLNKNSHFLLTERGTTNHCPMALVALANMGANEQRMTAFYLNWKNSFIEKTHPSSLNFMEKDWWQHCGNVDAFFDLQRYFERAVRQHGATTVFETVFKRISFAPASGAFHALIRMMYGYAARHEGEIAAGLAYMVCAHLPMDFVRDTDSIAPEHSKVNSVTDGLARLRTFSFQLKEANLISTRLRAIANDETFIQRCPRLNFYADAMQELAHIAITLYWQTADFTVLHMVTGLSAARQLFSIMPASVQAQWFLHVWRAFCASYVAVGAPRIDDGLLRQDADSQANISHCLNRNAEEWADMFAQACASDDEHVIKMTYTCFLENQAEQHSLYVAAARRLLAK